MPLQYEVVKDILPSFAEKKLAAALLAGGIVFEQEVTFENCVNPLTGARLRYDFYLPAQNTLIEYDSVQYHEGAEVRLRDRVKTKFAKDNGIRLIRIQGISNIDKLLGSQLNINIKPTPMATPKVKAEPLHAYKQRQIQAEENQKTLEMMIALRKEKPGTYARKLAKIKNSNKPLYLWIKERSEPPGFHLPGWNRQNAKKIRYS